MLMTNSRVHALLLTATRAITRLKDTLTCEATLTLLSVTA